MLSYYASHSSITDPGRFSTLLDVLPNDPAELTQIIQGLLIHKLEVQLYNIQISPTQRQEQYLRTVQQILERVQSIDPAPFSAAREPQQRVVSICRDFALLFVSFCRQAGIPARMRVGYAAYLDPSGQFRYDHWVGEYWNGDRWVLVDPQIDAVQHESFKITCNTLDLRRDQDFYLAGSAWQLARAGKIKSTLFRFNGHWKGFPCIRGNLLHDLQALNKIELTPMDYWDRLSTMPEHELSVEDKALLDQTAELTASYHSSLEEIQDLFHSMPRTKIIFDKLRILGILAEGETIEASDLQQSSAERLAKLGVNGSNGRNGKRDIVIPEYQPYDPAPHMTQSAGIAAQTFGIGDIVVRGAQQHNLKRIDVVIPRHRMVVVTGVSGSGKSSLAFDTIYAEGQRRYVESLSSYARQFMEQMEKPKVDQITGLSPAIAIEQKTVSRNPRSTVGTVTEILDYLRVLYARAGLPHCPECGRAVQPQTAQQITNRLLDLAPGTRFQLLAPIARGRKGTYLAALKQAAKDGYTRARVNGFPLDLSSPQEIDELKLDKNRKHFIELVVDRLIVPPELDEEFEVRLADSVETTLRTGGGLLLVVLDNEELLLSEHNACPHCDLSFPELQPNMFSFNSPFGMCPECNGLGVKLQVDPNLIIERPELSLLDGASRWFGEIRKKKNQWLITSLEPVAAHFGADLETPYKDLPEEFRHVLLHGSGELKFRYQRQGGNGEQTWKFENTDIFRGAIHHINRLFRQTHSEYTRRWYLSFMSQLPCPKCNAERLTPEARFVTLIGKRLPELTSLSIEALYEWICSLPDQFDSEQYKIASELVEEIRLRLQFLRNVGLHYLALDRPAPTLSGGEGQRIRLASQIGSGLVGVLYILDEPSIGLHTRDHRALLDTLLHLRDIGNTVLVVEHDADTMRCADWILDLGPGPGVLGGRLVSAGTPEDIMRDPDSITGKYLSGELKITSPTGFVRRPPRGWLVLKGARLHNLKSIDTRFPLGVLTCVTGVSGSGKSSLVAKTLEPALARLLQNAQTSPGPYDSLEGLEQVNKVINITQDPIGRNPRSNPGTYSGVMDEIRKVFAATPEAKARGYEAGRFSMNTKGGRCEACAGYGTRKVEMHFLPDVWVRCKECEGRRFNRQTLEVTYKGKTIADVLDMDVQEALDFFSAFPAISRILQTLHDVGLDYMKLGQSALTLSGGEAQRVKLAKELSRAATGKTIYILDEPTTGLHFADIQRLLDVLHRLVDAGNTVLVIEHNLDIIKSSDWIIDLGPEGGVKGGYIIAEGSPEAVCDQAESYTGKFLREALERQRIARPA
jgi:excinuclease ABC subunit A